MQYYLFLRAVNVGKRKMPSADLQQLLESLKFKDVGVFLASGNAVFDSRKRADRLEILLEKEVEKRFGFLAECFVRTAQQIQELAAANPFTLNEDETRQFTQNVVFFRKKPSPSQWKNIQALSGDYDGFELVGDHLFWLCRGPKMSASPIAETLPKVLPAPNTTRKRDTLIRLLAKFSAS